MKRAEWLTVVKSWIYGSRELLCVKNWKNLSLLKIWCLSKWGVMVQGRSSFLGAPSTLAVTPQIDKHLILRLLDQVFTDDSSIDHNNCFIVSICCCSLPWFVFLLCGFCIRVVVFAGMSSMKSPGHHIHDNMSIAVSWYQLTIC